MRKIILLAVILLSGLLASAQNTGTSKDTIFCYGPPVFDPPGLSSILRAPKVDNKQMFAALSTAPSLNKIYKRADYNRYNQPLVISVSGAIDTVPTYKNFNDFNTRVLKGNVGIQPAQKAFAQLTDYIRQWLVLRNQVDVSKGWVFPLQGYNYHAIGGSGDGYSDKGYRYLDGNKHTAHPAHDIFINDKNQDCRDDRTNKPVNVLAVDYGIVIACSNEWESTSNLRGGKYIWIYHYNSHIITYYAHNNAIFVKPGDRVLPGQKIAEVGRTGYNAYKKRSPTHLHFSAFRLPDGLPVPFNPYSELKEAKTL